MGRIVGMLVSAVVMGVIAVMGLEVVGELQADAEMLVTFQETKNQRMEELLEDVMNGEALPEDFGNLQNDINAEADELLRQVNGG